jgi:phage-related baseplate assembly protein
MRRDALGPYSLDALKAMGAPVLFSTDAAQWRAKLVAWFEEASGRKLYPMQVEMLLVETLAYALSVVGEEAQMALEQSLVTFAGEAGLERLAPNRSTPRLPAAKARFTLRCSRQGSATAIFIPKGTRAGAQNGVVFATLADATLPAGVASIDLTAEAMASGAAANDAPAGAVTALLDPISGLAVANVTPAEGGADEEELEAWRLRLANAFERVSTGGSRAWYRETAMGVSSALVDVAVIRPQPCYVDLYPLTRDGAAGPDLRAQVLAAFETREALDVRFGDLVAIKPAVAVDAGPRLVLRGRGMEASVVADAEKLARATLDRFDFGSERPALRDLAQTLFGGLKASGWSQRLGADVAPSEVERAVKRLPGVVDAELTGLAFQTLAPTSYLRLTSLAVEAQVLS